MFYSGIINDAKKSNSEVAAYKNIPFVSKVTQHQVMDNFPY